MKKFYFLIFTGVFILSAFTSLGQSIYSSITSNPFNYTLDDKRFWQGDTAAPRNPCINCTIVINSNVTMVSSHQTSTEPADNGSLDLDKVVIDGGSLKVVAGVSVTIDTYVQLFNTAVIIGNDPTTAASIILNGQVDINGTSTIRLANDNVFIDVNDDDGPTPAVGPRYPANNPALKLPGLYYIQSDGGTPTDPTDDVYDWTLNRLVIGNTTYTLGQKYLINCSPNVPGAPFPCVVGLIYGPAELQHDISNNFWGFGQSTPLPVVLVQFLATKNADASIKLSWATAQEINSASFEMERSADQGNWQNIGSVKAKGYSSTTANYSFTDQLPAPGNNYYRLKMVDLDGKFKYSQVVAVTSEKDGRPLVIYSNPFSDQIRMKVNVGKAQNLSLTVTDIIGKTYLKQSYNAQAGDNLINLAPAGAARGMYILHIQGSTYEQTIKLAKQ